jgi:hypothetical protein
MYLRIQRRLPCDTFCFKWSINGKLSQNIDSLSFLRQNIRLRNANCGLQKRNLIIIDYEIKKTFNFIFNIVERKAKTPDMLKLTMKIPK